MGTPNPRNARLGKDFYKSVCNFAYLWEIPRIRP